ncbi:hypothetical protein ABTB15_19700, partial [Acinetobacter baumannii]
KTMGIASQSFLNEIAAVSESLGSRLPADALERRAKQRRQIQGMIGISYLNAGILLIYAYAGTVPVWVGPAYAITGLLLVMLG